MKAVVMAGGLGTRMRPLLAPPINKHLMPVAGMPLIFHPLALLARSGVTEVLILLNGEHPELLLKTIGDGSQFGLQVLYRYLPETHGASVGLHLNLAKVWTRGEPFLLILGDGYYQLEYIPQLSRKLYAPHIWAMPLDAQWDDPKKYALVPNESKWVQTGLWLFDDRVFASICTLEKAGGEIRIRHIVEHLHTTQQAVTFTKLPTRSYIDCGTPEAIAQVNALEYKGRYPNE